MKKMKLQTRFFLTYIMLALMLVLLFSSLFFSYTSKILVERETQNIVNLVTGFQTQTDDAVSALDTVSINVGYSNLIKQKLEQYFEQDSINWANTSTLAELFVAINGTDTRADQINIYDFNGNIIGFGRAAIMNKIDLAGTDWYEPTLKLNGHKYISPPYVTDSMSKTSKADISYISLYRVYFNKYGKPVGFVETIKTSKSIFKNIIAYSNRNRNNLRIYVFNNSGDLIYPYEPSNAEDLSASNHYFYSMKDDSNHTILANPETNVRELVAYQKSPYTDWTYITVMPEETILKPVQNLFRMLLWVVVLFIAISVAISFYMSLSLTKPIHKLRNIIYKTELDTLGIHNDSSLDTSIDELEELNQAFQNMSTKLKNSMNELIYTRQQEMRSRNMALQSQINPHFYYNSLSSIIILAENGRCEDVVTLCRSLGSIMRYIAKDSENTVTLGEEIDYIKKYLYCMKIRYQSSLNYHINIDESLLDIKIPKLIIQPLVENAIKYGTDCTPPWDIYIKSTVSDDYWRIDVIDSGNGFPDEIIETLNEKINNAKNHIGIPNIEIDGMGLVNVYSRWKLHCGNNIIFTFGNMEKGGGIVSIGRYLKNAIYENGPSTLPSDS